MRGRTMVLGLGLLVSLPANAQQAASVSRCRSAQVEGEVASGKSFTQAIGSGLRVVIDPLASGWRLRILPQQGSPPAQDYAELATPPYHSVNPLLISTDFSFRAQDAVGWNKRRFRFAANPADFDPLRKAYTAYEAHASPAAEQDLSRLVSRMPQGSLTILDARLVPGTADQPRAASTLASHFGETAHTIESPAGAPTPLGRLNWMRFRIALELPPGFHPEPHLVVKSQPCDL
jgi:hypothetical protein